MNSDNITFVETLQVSEVLFFIFDLKKLMLYHRSGRQRTNCPSQLSPSPMS